MNGAFGAVAIPNCSLLLGGNRAQQLRPLRVVVQALYGIGQVGAENSKAIQHCRSARCASLI